MIFFNSIVKFCNSQHESELALLWWTVIHC